MVDNFLCAHGEFHSNRCKIHKGKRGQEGYCPCLYVSLKPIECPGCYKKGKVAPHYFAGGSGGFTPGIDQHEVDRLLIMLRNKRATVAQINAMSTHEGNEALRRWKYGGYIQSEYVDTLEDRKSRKSRKR
jgi:hypothetical protein